MYIDNHILFLLISFQWSNLQKVKEKNTFTCKDMENPISAFHLLKRFTTDWQGIFTALQVENMIPKARGMFRSWYTRENKLYILRF